MAAEWGFSTVVDALPVPQSEKDAVDRRLLYKSAFSLSAQPAQSAHNLLELAAFIILFELARSKGFLPEIPYYACLVCALYWADAGNLWRHCLGPFLYSLERGYRDIPAIVVMLWLIRRSKSLPVFGAADE